MLNDYFLFLVPTIGKKSAPLKVSRLPLVRIKHIMKLDPDVSLISQEAIFLVTMATHLFIEHLSRESYSHTVQQKKKTIQKNDVEMAINSIESLIFLEGANY